MCPRASTQTVASPRRLVATESNRHLLRQDFHLLDLATLVAHGQAPILSFSGSSLFGVGKGVSFSPPSLAG